MSTEEKKDAVIEAARAFSLFFRPGDEHPDAARARRAEALQDALSALDETPEARVVRCARAAHHANTGWQMGPLMAELGQAVRALPEAPDADAQENTE